MITGKVLDSVKQITEYANTLIESGDKVKSMDIAIASTELQSAVKKLNEAFDSQPENRGLLFTLKSEVDRKALLIEKLICVRTGEFKDKIALREFAEALYSDVMLRIKDLSEMKGLKESTIVEWTSYTPFIMRLYICSKQTCFELDSEDEEMIKKISSSMFLEERRP